MYRNAGSQVLPSLPKLQLWGGSGRWLTCTSAAAGSGRTAVAVVAVCGSVDKGRSLSLQYTGRLHPAICRKPEMLTLNPVKLRKTPSALTFRSKSWSLSAHSGKDHSLRRDGRSQGWATLVFSTRFPASRSVPGAWEVRDSGCE